MKNIILIKENGKVRIENTTPELLALVEESTKENNNKHNPHLCWSCSNACADKCPKVADHRKKTIDKSYEFVNTCVQVIDEKGEVDRFIITDCGKFEKIQPKKLTVEDKARIKKAGEELRKMYFDTITLEDAYLAQEELLERGDISNPRGKRPSDYELWQMKQAKAREKREKARRLKKRY